MIEVLIGIAAGTITGLGMGGGTILIILLTNFLKINQKIAQAANLIFFLPTAIAVCIVNAKYKRINFRISIPIAIFSMIGAVIGAEIAIDINTGILRKLFATFLLIIAIYEIYELVKQRKNNSKE